MTTTIIQHITRTEGLCGGRACIAGHRLRVMDIVVLYELRGMSSAEIVYQYPGLSMAAVHAALAYYDNQEEIRQEFRKDEEWARWTSVNLPSKIPSGLREKIVG